MILFHSLLLELGPWFNKMSQLSVKAALQDPQVHGDLSPYVLAVSSFDELGFMSGRATISSRGALSGQHGAMPSTPDGAVFLSHLINHLFDGQASLHRSHIPPLDWLPRVFKGLSAVGWRGKDSLV